MEDVELERLLDKKNVLDKEFPKFFTPTVLLINGCECRERGGVPCWLRRFQTRTRSLKCAAAHVTDAYMGVWKLNCTFVTGVSLLFLVAFGI